jgi:hypothetical protein
VKTLLRRIGLVLCSFALLQAASSFSAPTVTIGQNFLASSGTNVAALPPDPNGAIGPNHFVEFINGEFAVFYRDDIPDPLRESDIDFWANAGVVLASDQGISDPRVIYDPISQRWFASQVDFNSTTAANGGDVTLNANDFLVAVSLTSDPSGDWVAFKFRSDPSPGHGAFADFPTLGVDSNGVYISGDMFKGEANSMGPNLVSIPKADLLAAIPTIANRTYFGVLDTNLTFGQVVQPATCFDGSVTGAMLSMGDIGTDSDPHSNMVTFSVLNAGGPGATHSAPVDITVNPYVVPYNSDLDVPVLTATQPDGTATLLANDARLAAKVYAVGGVLYAVHSTEYNNRIAIRWYRINATNHVVLEQGLISDTNLDLFFPSIAANANGSVVIACNGSSVNTYISCFAYVGQTVNGVTSFGNSILLQSGLANYHDLNEIIGTDLGTPTDSRWGDYSATSVDPNDPTHFWTILMFPSDVDTEGFGEGIWSTQVTELIVSPQPQLTVATSGTNALISWPSWTTAFQLQSNTNLLGTNWVAVTRPLSTNGNQISALVPLSNKQQFFRLTH